MENYSSASAAVAASISTVVCCMPMIFHSPSSLTRVMSYLPPCQPGTVGEASLLRLEMTLPVMEGIRSTTVQVA